MLFGVFGYIRHLHICNLKSAHYRIVLVNILPSSKHLRALVVETTVS